MAKIVDWVPVDESLPEEFEDVIVTVSLYNGQYDTDRGSYTVDDGGDVTWDLRYYSRINPEDVLAWAPLPDPYEGDGL